MIFNKENILKTLNKYNFDSQNYIVISGAALVLQNVKEYIHKNYAVPSLSVPDVSQYVHLSSSYVCTIFKNETGLEEELQRFI